MEIRFAEIGDMDEVVPLVEELLRDTNMGKYVVADKKSIEYNMLDRITKNRMLVLPNNENKAIGIATWMTMTPYWNMYQLVGITEFIVLAAEARGQGGGKKLHQARLDVLKELGCSFVISDQVKDAKTGDMYKSMGYEHFQNNFIKAL